MIVTFAGSWCPNCHDEAAFLAAAVSRVPCTGPRDRVADVRALRRFRRRRRRCNAAVPRQSSGIEYATLIAGTSNRDDAARALPQLNGVFAYPTTIWVDRTGRVRRIHAGFAGPATGWHHEQLVHEFTEFTQELLAEPAEAVARCRPVTLFLAKLTLTPLIMYLTSAAGRRWGPGVSGGLTGLPLLAGPVSVCVCIEQGPGFAGPRGGRHAARDVVVLRVLPRLLLTGSAWGLGSRIVGVGGRICVRRKTALLNHWSLPPWAGFAGVLASARDSACG